MKTLLWALCLTVALATPLLAGKQPGIVVYLSDFGLRDGAVAAMKGVACGVDPWLRLYDITHQVPPFDVWDGAYRLRQAAPYWPRGTVFVAVVDPGVGTERRAIVLRTGNGMYFVGPDNGLFTLVAEDMGVGQVRVIDLENHRLPGSKLSNTFFGRDVFSLVAAKLASGAIRFDQVGPSSSVDLVRLKYQHAVFENGTATGTITVLDLPYGNVWTNINRLIVDELAAKIGDTLIVRFYHNDTLQTADTLPYVSTFGDVPAGKGLAYGNSLLELSFATNMGDYAGTHGIGCGPGWRVAVRRK